MKKHLMIAIFLGTLLLLPSCKRPDSNDGIIPKGIKQSIRSAKDTVADLTSDGSEMAQGEVEKLFVFEYKVVEFQMDLPASELQESLTLLGRERWDCFHVEPQELSNRFFCKRRPKTYLRYIPRVF